MELVLSLFLFLFLPNAVVVIVLRNGFNGNRSMCGCWLFLRFKQQNGCCFRYLHDEERPKIVVSRFSLRLLVGLCVCIVCGAFLCFIYFYNFTVLNISVGIWRWECRMKCQRYANVARLVKHCDFHKSIYRIVKKWTLKCRYALSFHFISNAKRFGLILVLSSVAHNFGHCHAFHIECMQQDSVWVHVRSGNPSFNLMKWYIAWTLGDCVLGFIAKLLCECAPRWECMFGDGIGVRKPLNKCTVYLQNQKTMKVYWPHICLLSVASTITSFDCVRM